MASGRRLSASPVRRASIGTPKANVLPDPVDGVVRSGSGSIDEAQVVVQFNAAAEARPRRERLVDMQRIGVAGDGDEALDVVLGESLGEGRVLAGFELFDARAGVDVPGSMMATTRERPSVPKIWRMAAAPASVA